MDLRQLKALVAVSEEKTFIGAARRLNVAQPALSRQIRSFEKEIGTAVFQRGRAGVTLTPTGEICLRAAYSIIENIGRAVSNARLANEGKAGTCTVYASQWAVWTGFTGKFLAHTARHDPGIDVVVREGEIGTQWECLRKHHVDLSIATIPPSGYDDLRSEILLDDFANIALLSPRHPLADRQSIRLEELRDETLLSYESKVISLIEDEIRRAFARVGFKPKRVQTLDNTESLLARISAGMGWSIHRRSLKGKIPGVATVPIEDFGVPLPVTLIHRAHETQPHVLEVARRIRETAVAEYPSMRPFAGYHEPQANGSSEPSRDGEVELRDLRYFAAVVEERGIGRAAVRLGLTQPALSRQIRAIEHDIGLALVARATRGVVPTIAGKSLYAAARDILGEVSRLPAEVERGQRAAAGRCVIASIPSLLVRDMLSEVMRTAGERFPHLEISVHHVPTPDQPNALRNGEYDVGLCHPFSNLVSGFDDIDIRELLSDYLAGALLPPMHPLAVRDSIRFDDLADIPFIFIRREFHQSFYDFILESFRQKGYVPKLAPPQNGLQTVWSMCESGAGWALAFASHRENPPAGLTMVPIEGFNIPWGVNILSRKNESRPAARLVMDLLFEEAAGRNLRSSPIASAAAT